MLHHSRKSSILCNTCPLHNYHPTAVERRPWPPLGSRAPGACSTTAEKVLPSRRLTWITLTSPAPAKKRGVLSARLSRYRGGGRAPPYPPLAPVLTAEKILPSRRLTWTTLTSPAPAKKRGVLKKHLSPGDFPRHPEIIGPDNENCNVTRLIASGGTRLASYKVLPSLRVTQITLTSLPAKKRGVVNPGIAEGRLRWSS